MLSDTFIVFSNTIAFYAISIPLTYMLTLHPVLSWILMPVVLLRIVTLYAPRFPLLFRTASALHIFKCFKICSSVAALFVVNLAQFGQESSIHAIALILGLNMLEACVTDLVIATRFGWPNALGGVVLVIALFVDAWKHPSGEVFSSPDGIFLFPLKLGWVVCYSIWNANFAFGVGFAWSFSLSLISPLAVSYLLGLSSWLGARTYSLVLNQALRGSNACWLFCPGKSFVTKKDGDPPGDEIVRWCMGIINIIIILVVYIEGGLMV
jgi:hypothetical protein